MSEVRFNIDLPDVDLDSLNSEEDFRKEAQRLLPGALKQLAEVTAEEAWSSLQKGLKKVPGLKLNKSTADKAKFVRDSAKSFKPVSSMKSKTERAKYDRLKELKAKERNR